jgi:hypothetical protein
LVDFTNLKAEIITFAALPKVIEGWFRSSMDRIEVS